MSPTRSSNEKRGRPILATVVVLFLLLLAVLWIFLCKPRRLYWRGRQISIELQSLTGRAFQDEGMWIRSGWADPRGYAHGDLYGIKVRNKIFRIDVTYDRLGDIKKHLPPSLAGLLQELKSPDHLVRKCIVERLAEMRDASEPALPILLDRYDTGDEGAGAALTELSRVTTPRGLSVLIQALTNRPPRTVSLLTESFGEMGTNAVAAVSALSSLLTNAVSTNALAAAYALSKIECGDHGEISALAKLLTDPESETRASAVAVLAEFGPASAPIADALLKFLDEPGPTSGLAARTFGLMGPAGRIAIPRLIMLLDTSDPLKAGFVTGALGESGPSAEAAIPKLCQIAEHPDEAHRAFDAVMALARIGTNSLPCLLRLYHKEKPDYGLLSVALSSMGPGAASAAPNLVTELNSENPYRAAAAARALGAIGPGAKAAADALTARLNEGNAQLRLSAAAALWHIARATNTVLPVMVRELSEWSLQKDALRSIQSEAGQGSRQQVAAQVLSEIGPAAEDAIPLLQFMQQSTFPEQRGAATEALRSIMR